MPFWIKMFLTLGGSGLSPKAPGTMGSLVALVLLFLFFSLDFSAWRFVYLALFWVIYIASLFMINNFVQKPYDKSWIVVDEWLGMQLSFLPFLFFPMMPGWALVAFGLFRLFDIVKPLGIGHIDKKGTPQSVLHDDILAGVYTALVLTVLIVCWQ